MSLCLASATVALSLGWTTFTLAWTHSVEKTEWQEDWQVVASGLELVEARVRGTGAGMEPPPEAQFIEGWWRYRPRIDPIPELVLARYEALEDWRICHGNRCSRIERYIGAHSGTVAFYPCSG